MPSRFKVVKEPKSKFSAIETLRYINTPTYNNVEYVKAALGDCFVEMQGVNLLVTAHEDLKDCYELNLITGLVVRPGDYLLFMNDNFYPCNQDTYEALLRTLG